MNPLRAVVVSCDRGRLDAFHVRWDAIGAPLPLEVVSTAPAQDGRAGCWQSHLDALGSSSGPTLVLEDDAVFADSFRVAVDWPDDCQLGYYGGEHLARPVVTGAPIQPVFVVRRTHAYVVTEPQALAAAIGLPRPGVDITSAPAWRRLVRYGLTPFTVGQAAGASLISGRASARARFWNGKVQKVNTWRDLADSELRNKLAQRGLNSLTIESFVRHRDHEDVAAALDHLLEHLRGPAHGRAPPGRARLCRYRGHMTQTASAAAEKALAFALAQVGKGYSETPALRLGPTDYDCSGLVYEAYLSAGVTIGLDTFSDWPNGAGEHVAAGAENLLPGDLLFFAYELGGTAEHVAMVVSVTAGVVEVVEAADPAQGVITTSGVDPTVGAPYGTNTLVYIGATRPAPPPPTPPEVTVHYGIVEYENGLWAVFATGGQVKKRHLSQATVDGLMALGAERLSGTPWTPEFVTNLPTVA